MPSLLLFSEIVVFDILVCKSKKDDKKKSQSNNQKNQKKRAIGFDIFIRIDTTKYCGNVN